MAPFDGEVTNLGNLKEQQWLNEDTAILKLVNKNNYQVSGINNKHSPLLQNLLPVELGPSSKTCP